MSVMLESLRDVLGNIPKKQRHKNIADKMLQHELAGAEPGGPGVMTLVKNLSPCAEKEKGSKATQESSRTYNKY